MSSSSRALLAERRNNAILGWAIVVFLVAVALGSVFDGQNGWAIFVCSVVVLCIIPPVAYGDPEVMLPWELIGMAALPTFGHLIATFELFSQLHLYFSIAALALIIAVELDMFSSVKMTVGFAIVFVLLATMAATGTWAVFRWSVDQLLGTQLLLEAGRDTREIHDELMYEFVYSAIAGLVASLTFELYYRRQMPVQDRIPEAAEVSDP